MVHIIAGLLSIPFAIARIFRSSWGRHFFEPLALRSPVVGAIMRTVAVDRFTRTLGTTIAAGLPILEALDISASASATVILVKEMNRARGPIRDGESIGRTLDGCALVPATVVAMLSIGEEQGGLDSMLLKAADGYDGEVDRALIRIRWIIEPLVIVFMGLVIGGGVLAVFMSMLCTIHDVG